MVFNWLYKSKQRNTEQVILHKRTYKIQKDWELIRSATEIEKEVDFVEDVETNKDRQEYGSIEPEPDFDGSVGQQFTETFSDEISEEINQCNFASSTPVTPMSLSKIIANEDEYQSDDEPVNVHEMETNVDICKEEKKMEPEDKVIFKSIDEIIDDLKESEASSTTRVNNKAKNVKINKSSRCKKRKIASYKSRRARRYNNRRKARKSK